MPFEGAKHEAHYGKIRPSLQQSAGTRKVNRDVRLRCDFDDRDVAQIIVAHRPDRCVVTDPRLPKEYENCPSARKRRIVHRLIMTHGLIGTADQFGDQRVSLAIRTHIVQIMLRTETTGQKDSTNLGYRNYLRDGCYARSEYWRKHRASSVRRGLTARVQRRAGYP